MQTLKARLPSISQELQKMLVWSLLIELFTLP